VFEMY